MLKNRRRNIDASNSTSKFRLARWVGLNQNDFFTLYISRLNDLRNKLLNEGIADINFVIINAGDSYSQSLIHLLHGQVDSSFPVLQEPTAGAVWNVFFGRKDDMIIFDR